MCDFSNNVGDIYISKLFNSQTFTLYPLKYDRFFISLLETFGKIPQQSIYLQHILVYIYTKSAVADVSSWHKQYKEDSDNQLLCTCTCTLYLVDISCIVSKFKAMV